MEPSLNDMDDYNKPTSGKKVKTIVLAFVGLIVLYGIYVIVMKSFT